MFFFPETITKLKRKHTSGLVKWQLFDTKDYIFFKVIHTKLYYEDILQNPKMCA